MKKIFLSILLAMLMLLSIVTILPLTVFATSTTYAITNGTAQDANGTISIDKKTAAEGETGSGEWFGYCTEDSQFSSSAGAGFGTSITFAIRIPVASLPNQDVLSKVSFYTYDSNTYHVRIYSTDPSVDPGTATPDYEQEVTVSNPNKWEDVVLTTPMW